MGRVPEAPERTRRGCRRVARSDSCGSTGENAEGAKQAAPTAEGCSAQTATAEGRKAPRGNPRRLSLRRGGCLVAGPKHRHPDVFHVCTHKAHIRARRGYEPDARGHHGRVREELAAGVVQWKPKTEV